jgi:hypothetical protein
MTEPLTALQGTNLYTPDASVLLTPQLDGNLVLYNTGLFNKAPETPQAALWATGSYNMNNGPALYPTFGVQSVRNPSNAGTGPVQPPAWPSTSCMHQCHCCTKSGVCRECLGATSGEAWTLHACFLVKR